MIIDNGVLFIFQDNISGNGKILNGWGVCSNPGFKRITFLNQQQLISSLKTPHLRYVFFLVSCLHDNWMVNKLVS